LFVIFFHCLILFEASKILVGKTIEDAPVLRILAHGDSAVALFMTLSGFLFSLICGDKNINLWSFYRNRILRIYPLFVFILLLACSLDPRHNDFWSLFRSIFFMHNLTNAVSYKQLTEVLWTVAVEFQFYLLFPFLLIFYRKFGLKYLFLLLTLAVGTKAVVYYLTGSVSVMAYETIFGRIDQFVVGMILGLSYERLKGYFASPVIFFAILGATFFMLFAAPRGLHETSDSALWVVRSLIEGAVWGILIISYVATSFSLPPFVSRLIAFGGALSFSLYVNHFFLLRLFARYIPLVYGHHSRYPLFCQVGNWLQIHPIASLFCFILGFELPATLVASVLTYYVIEKPFLSLRSQYIIKPADVIDVLPGQQLAAGVLPIAEDQAPTVLVGRTEQPISVDTQEGSIPKAPVLGSDLSLVK
jgi:peptidoglycan/LPS O-acetylase OafA/YrhL